MPEYRERLGNGHRRRNRTYKTDALGVLDRAKDAKPDRRMHPRMLGAKAQGGLEESVSSDRDDKN